MEESYDHVVDYPYIACGTDIMVFYATSGTIDRLYWTKQSSKMNYGQRHRDGPRANPRATCSSILPIDTGGTQDGITLIAYSVWVAR